MSKAIPAATWISAAAIVATVFGVFLFLAFPLHIVFTVPILAAAFAASLISHIVANYQDTELITPCIAYLVSWLSFAWSFAIYLGFAASMLKLLR